MPCGPGGPSGRRIPRPFPVSHPSHPAVSHTSTNTQLAGVKLVLVTATVRQRNTCTILAIVHYPGAWWITALNGAPARGHDYCLRSQAPRDLTCNRKASPWPQHPRLVLGAVVEGVFPVSTDRRVAISAWPWHCKDYFRRDYACHILEAPTAYRAGTATRFQNCAEHTTYSTEHCDQRCDRGTGLEPLTISAMAIS